MSLTNFNGNLIKFQFAFNWVEDLLVMLVVDHVCSFVFNWWLIVFWCPN